MCGAATLSYDLNGNLTSDGMRTYTYDGEGDGHIITATGAGLDASYQYDPFGRRYSKTVSGATTYYLHDDQGNEISEHEGNWNIRQRVVYDGLHVAPVAMVSSTGAVTYNYFDRAGSVMTVGNASGTMVTQYAYLPYGDSNPPNIALCRSGTCGNAGGTGFGYAGYRYDTETGLYHTATRYYEPRLGRFIQPDPIGQAGGLNLYAYVQNDPLNATDPLGLCASSQCGNANPSNQLIQTGNGCPPGAPDCVNNLGGAMTSLIMGGASGGLIRTIGGMIISQVLSDQTAATPNFNLQTNEPQYNYTQTVANNASSRPYVNSPLTVQQITSTGTGMPDPGGIPGALRYEVPGSFGRSQGTYELVIDPQSNTIYHFLFRSR